MYKSMNTYNRYQDFINKIRDEQIRSLFVQLTHDYPYKDTLLDGNSNHYYDILSYINDTSFDELTKDSYMKMVFFSDPSAMILKIEDESFLEVLEKYWTNFLNRSDEIMYSNFITIIVRKYPTRFRMSLL